MRIITFNCPGNFDINMFGEFDLFFIQRMPRNMLWEIAPYEYHTSYINNYESRGLGIVSKNLLLENNIKFSKFSVYAENALECQGKYWQILNIDTRFYGLGTMPIKIINALPSFPEEESDTTDVHRIAQTAELLDMIDDNTVLVGDFHSTDENLELELKLESRNLINYIKDYTFTCEDGTTDSLDKIITTNTSSIRISNVSVITNYLRDHIQGHWPIAFDLEI